MLERLERLEENIASLKVMQRRYSVEDIRNNKFDEWALRYGLLESIQIVIDLACHISGKYNLGSAKTYGECIENLQRHGYLPEAVASKLIAAVGLRNLLVHEYAVIDTEKLYGFLAFHNDFADFIRHIADVM